MNRDHHSDKVAEAVAQQIEPVYCVKCGSKLQILTVKRTGFDKKTGYPRYEVRLRCPTVVLYETRITRRLSFTWRERFPGHTTHKVSKVIEMAPNDGDTQHKRGDAPSRTVESMNYCPDCGKAGTEGMKFCTQCGQKLTDFDLTGNQKSERYGGKMRTAAGILLLILGMTLLVSLVLVFMATGIPSFGAALDLLMILYAAFVVTGGVFCLKRRNWIVCLSSALAAVVFMIIYLAGPLDTAAWLDWFVIITGILPIIFVCLGKSEWQTPQI